MSTAIEWTDETWNPVVGCSRVSAGCKNCYAFQLHDMRHKAFQLGRQVPVQYAHPFTKVQLRMDRLGLPASWKKPRMVFVNSMSDLFHEDVPFEFILEVWNRMAATPHTYQILTKRAGRMLGFFEWLKEGMRERGLDKWEEGPVPLPNVWLGVSVEDQRAADERIPLLLHIPAAVRFLSCEPLLEDVDIGNWLQRFRCHACGATSSLIHPADSQSFEFCEDDTIHADPSIDWVIVGGESGPGARPMHPDWARSLRDQCQAAGVPYFFKQWGEFVHNGEPADWARQTFNRVGKKAAGRMLDGREWNEFPGGPKA